MGIVQDIRFAVRVLLKKPTFTLVVIVTLALGIGAGSAMFSVLHSLLVRPVDFPDLDRIAMVQLSREGREFDSEMTPAGFLDFRDQAKSFERLAAMQWWEVPISGSGEPEQVLAFQVSEGFFDLIGVRPVLGRWFAPDEVDGQKENVVILSHRLWERRYAKDPSVLGKSITVAGGSYVVVGIMPPGFGYPKSAELWAPITLDAEQRRDRTSSYLSVIGRLAPGASLGSADAEIRQLGQRQADLHPEAATLRFRLVSLAQGISDAIARILIMILFGAALFVGLIACANVANVFLAYALARRRELAVRAALGASRGRIVRQLLTESVLLGLVAGAASLLVAGWAIDLIKGSMPSAIARFISGWETMGLDPYVLAFALSLGLLVGFIFGIVPALQVSRTDVNSILKDEGRGATISRESHRLRNFLVVGQVALALSLLLGAGALVKGFVNLTGGRHAIDGDGVLTLRVQLPVAREAPPKERILAFEQRTLERLRALPGVLEAGTVNIVPWADNGAARNVFPEGRVLAPGETLSVDYRAATPGYTELFRIARIAGRTLAPTDGADAPRVAMLSSGAVSRLWPGGDPIGKRLRFSTAADAPWVTVVGIVADVPDRNDELGPRPAIYVPFDQAPTAGMYFVLRADGAPLALAKSAQTAIFSVDPSQPVTGVRTMDMVIAERLSGNRIASGMMSGFALLALILAAVGLYGVVATLVAQRTHEIGVRMALGAQRLDVVRLIVGKGLYLTVIGVTVGLAAGYVLVRFLGSVLPPGMFDASALLFVIFTAIVLAIAAFGSLFPALRASRLDPLDALRS